jgi:hypothetical protein
MCEYILAELHNTENNFHAYRWMNGWTVRLSQALYRTANVPKIVVYLRKHNAEE